MSEEMTAFIELEQAAIVFQEAILKFNKVHDTDSAGLMEWVESINYTLNEVERGVRRSIMKRMPVTVSQEWEDQHYPLDTMEEPELPSVSLKFCEYDKKRKVLKLASEFFGMPRSFFVKSHHTGKEIQFVPVTYDDVLFDEDGWDGEQMIYRPVGNVPNVDHMVIYNQY